MAVTIPQYDGCFPNGDASGASFWRQKSLARIKALIIGCPNEGKSTTLTYYFLILKNFHLSVPLVGLYKFEPPVGGWFLPSKKAANIFSVKK
jgi:hypothetical protein